VEEVAAGPAIRTPPVETDHRHKPPQAETEATASNRKGPPAVRVDQRDSVAPAGKPRLMMIPQKAAAVATTRMMVRAQVVSVTATPAERVGMATAEEAVVVREPLAQEAVELVART